MLVVELDGSARVLMTVMIALLNVLVEHDLGEVLQRQLSVSPGV